MKISFFSKRLSLRLKFALLIIIILVLIFSAQSFFLLSRNLAHTRSTLTNEVKTYTNLSTFPIGTSYNQYYPSNHFLFGEIIQGILTSSNQTITRLQLFNTNGDLLFDSIDLYRDDRENVVYKTLPPKKRFADSTLLAQLQKIDPTYTFSSRENS